MGTEDMVLLRWGNRKLKHCLLWVCIRLMVPYRLGGVSALCMDPWLEPCRAVSHQAPWDPRTSLEYPPVTRTEGQGHGVWFRTDWFLLTQGQALVTEASSYPKVL